VVTSEDDARWWHSDARLVSAAAGLIDLILADEGSRKSHLIAWLTGASGAGTGDGIAIRRAAIAALAADKIDIETILNKSLQQFGDQLYIRHTPAMQQEGMILKSSYAY
jgi:telomere length regulation protein